MRYQLKKVEIEAVQLKQDIKGYARAGDWLIVSTDGTQEVMGDEELNERYEPAFMSIMRGENLDPFTRTLSSGQSTSSQQCGHATSQ